MREEENQPPVWSPNATREQNKAYRAKALAYLRFVQKEAKNQGVNYATRYRQMTQIEELEDAFEDLKERIESATINAQADVGPAVMLQQEVAAFNKVLRSKCEKVNYDHPLVDMKD